MVVATKGVKTFVLMGSSGSGKSTITGLLRDRLAKSGIMYVNGGDEMKENAVRLGYTDDRDKLKYLPKAQQNECQKIMLDKIAGMDGFVFFDTHASIRNKDTGEYINGIPPERVPDLNIQVIFYLDVPALQVIERRNKQQLLRARDPETEETLGAQTIIDVNFMRRNAQIANVPIIIVQNLEDRREKAVGEKAADAIWKFIRSFLQ